MLTAALNADPVKSGQAYDVPAISQGDYNNNNSQHEEVEQMSTTQNNINNNNISNKNRFSVVLDLLHIMDYDYHGGWEEFTGDRKRTQDLKNHPLFGRPHGNIAIEPMVLSTFFSPCDLKSKIPCPCGSLSN